MRLGILGIIIFVIALVFSPPLFSQDKAENKKTETAEAEKNEQAEKEPSKLWVDLSGVMYFEWAYFTGFNSADGNNPWGKVARWGIDDTNLPTLSGIQPTDYSKK